MSCLCWPLEGPVQTWEPSNSTSHHLPWVLIENIQQWGPALHHGEPVTSWGTDGRASAGCCRVWRELNPGTVEEVSCCAPLPSKEEMIRKTSPPFPLALPTSSGTEWELMGRCSPPSRHWTQASVADMLKSPQDWIPLFSFDLKPPTVLTWASKGGLSGVNQAHLHSPQVLHPHFSS